MKNNLRIAFFGTPELTLTLLETLKGSSFPPVLIVTGEDKPVGRALTITPPAPKVWGEKNGIEVLQPKKLDSLFIETFREKNIDLSVVVAYGKIIPEELISIPRLGTINVHYSLLPKYRGATPVEAAILSGEKETGVVIQHMRYELDSGPIIKESRVSISPTEKAYELRSRLNEIAKALLVDSIEALASGTATFTEQNSAQATFCKKIKKEDGLLDLNDSAEKNYNKFRAYALWPRTYFFKDAKRVIITDAVLENNIFIIKKVIPEGKKEIPYDLFTKGA